MLAWACLYVAITLLLGLWKVGEYIAMARPRDCPIASGPKDAEMALGRTATLATDEVRERSSKAPTAPKR